MLSNKEIIKKIEDLARQINSSDIKEIKIMPPSGSYRQYYRIFFEDISMLGVYNADVKENSAYLSFADSFYKIGLPVPKTLIVDKAKDTYIIEDLGDETLINYLNYKRKENDNSTINGLYKKVIAQLICFQVEGAKVVDFEKCYPHHSFDVQSIKWDLNYFKYNFLKPAKIVFDELLLENDFNKFTDFLDQIDKQHFMYRDFQSSNIILVNGDPYFIDFQGGRHGPLQYDIASLLFDAKARLKHDLKLELLDYYITSMHEKYGIDGNEVLNRFYPVVLIRIMQAMGAYGFRGLIEKKAPFVKSIPLAVNNLKFVLSQYNNAKEYPELFNVFNKIIEAKNLVFPIHKSDKLTVLVTSFSYKRGIPDDYSGNGGGFVFDCRGIYNPGRQREFQHLTGKDDEVKTFLDNQVEMKKFLNSVTNLVSISVEEYINRGFSNLMVNFGCTGGQHRSVYAAENLAFYLKSKFDINVRVWHREQDFA